MNSPSKQPRTDIPAKENRISLNAEQQELAKQAIDFEKIFRRLEPIMNQFKDDYYPKELIEDLKAWAAGKPEHKPMIKNGMFPGWGSREFNLAIKIIKSHLNAKRKTDQLFLVISKTDHVDRAKRIIAKAQGNVDTFRKLFRQQFSTDPLLFDEKLIKKIETGETLLDPSSSVILPVK